MKTLRKGSTPREDHHEHKIEGGFQFIERRWTTPRSGLASREHQEEDQHHEKIGIKKRPSQTLERGGVRFNWSHTKERSSTKRSSNTLRRWLAQWTYMEKTKNTRRRRTTSEEDHCKRHQNTRELRSTIGGQFFSWTWDYEMHKF
jgi:hypothetical protein